MQVRLRLSFEGLSGVFRDSSPAQPGDARDLGKARDGLKGAAVSSRPAGLVAATLGASWAAKSGRHDPSPATASGTRRLQAHL